MRRLCSALVAVTLPFSGAIGAVGLPTRVEAAPATGTSKSGRSPKELYDEGRTAYRLGRYSDAVAAFEEAYSASGNALLLYNIALSYKDWYGVSKDIVHLRQARAVFRNYLREVQRDPSIGDPTEAEAQVREMDDLLAKAEAEAAQPERGAAAPEPAPMPTAAAEPGGPTTAGGPASSPAPQPAVAATDPGRKLRLAGIVTTSVGGAVLLAGVGLGAYMAFRGGQFYDALQDEYKTGQAAGCDPQRAASEQRSMTCSTIVGNQGTYRQNGNLANLYSGLAFGVGGGLGAAAVAAGVVLLVKGLRRTKAWKAAKRARDGSAPVSWSVTPVWSGSMRGLGVQGRF